MQSSTNRPMLKLNQSRIKRSGRARSKRASQLRLETLEERLALFNRGRGPRRRGQ